MQRDELAPRSARNIALVVISAVIASAGVALFPTLHVHHRLFAPCAGAFSALMWLLYARLSPPGLRSLPPDATPPQRSLYAVLTAIQLILLFAVVAAVA